MSIRGPPGVRARCVRVALVGGVSEDVLMKITCRGLVRLVVRTQGPMAQQQCDREEEGHNSPPPGLHRRLFVHVTHAAKGIKPEPTVALKLGRDGGPGVAAAAR
jgi:hypothetical protein